VVEVAVIRAENGGKSLFFPISELQPNPVVVYFGLVRDFHVLSARELSISNPEYYSISAINPTFFYYPSMNQGNAGFKIIELQNYPLPPEFFRRIGCFSPNRRLSGPDMSGRTFSGSGGERRV
jgi:hypothetical protein